MEDRSRRNNLRFDGFTEEGNDEKWEVTERKVKTFIKEELGISEEMKRIYDKKVHFVNEDFSEATAEVRKGLFVKVKELKRRGITAYVNYNKIVYDSSSDKLLGIPLSMIEKMQVSNK